MADAIRVSDGERWAYVPSTDENKSRLERFAKAGMAEISNGVVLLKSEGGPLFWNLLNKALTHEDDNKGKALEAMASNGIKILPDEQLHFGKKEDAEYNEFTDVSLAKQDYPDGGIKLEVRPIEAGEILMTAWPKTRRLIPAQASVVGKRVWLELAESQEKGDRCFVLDERCGSLITISFKTDGNKVSVVNPMAMDAWLCTAGSEAMMKHSGRFGVTNQASSFMITDSKNGKMYVGQFVSPADDADRVEFERLRIERMLGSKGLGAILPTYVLRNA